VLDEGATTAIRAAIDLIAATPGYQEVASDLQERLDQGRLRFAPDLDDRAQAGLTCVLTLGPEALGSSPLSLAGTLVHEHFHLCRQSPLGKTVSFWKGLLASEPVMREYEQPAYEAQEAFLVAVACAFPDRAHEALEERSMVAACFDGNYT
jgi:hypothetical protein